MLVDSSDSSASSSRVFSDASGWSMIGELSSFQVPFPELSDGNTLNSQLALISSPRITVLSQFLEHARREIAQSFMMSFCDLAVRLSSVLRAKCETRSVSFL